MGTRKPHLLGVGSPSTGPGRLLHWSQTTIDIFLKELDSTLVQSESVPEVCDVLHAIRRTRQGLVSDEPDGRDTVPATSS